MTYAITVTEPGKEPVAIEDGKSYATSEVLRAAIDYRHTGDINFFDLMRVCQNYLAATGRIKSFSLEWTAEAPKVAGMYMLRGEMKSGAVIEPYFVAINGPYEHRGDTYFCVDGYEDDFGNSILSDYLSDFERHEWLGPIPLAPGGE